MSTKAPKNFSHLWREATVAYEGVKKHGRLTFQHVAEFRRSAYRFARSYLQMEKHHHNELVAMIKSEGKTATEWMEERFGLIEEMNETRERLFAAIESGVTETEYAKVGTIIIAHKRIKAAKLVGKDDGVIPQPSGKATTLQEIAEEYRDLYESMKSKYQGVCKQLRIVEKELGHTTVRVKKM
jgi:hypothetical protein